MKKLMIAAAIVCAAVMSQAAQCTWKAGKMFTAANADGGWSTTALANNAATGYLFMLTESQYDTLLKDGFSQAGIYNGFTADGSSSTLKIGSDTLTATATAKYSMNNLQLKGGDVSGEGDMLYAALIYTYTDANLGDFYMANAASYEYGGSGTPSVGNLATAIGGATSAPETTQLGWQSVPEPTSGLLLLLGVGALALRRRRA